LIFQKGPDTLLDEIPHVAHYISIGPVFQVSVSICARSHR
jgi:hypothetical protein